MKTSVLSIRDMLSVLSVAGVEKRIGEVPGVESVTVDFDAANATVRYDETRVDIAAIKADVRQSGYEADAQHSGGKDVHEELVASGDPPTPHPASASGLSKHSMKLGGATSGVADFGKNGQAHPADAAVAMPEASGTPGKPTSEKN
jgi:Cu2+-exporting ATPase